MNLNADICLLSEAITEGEKVTEYNYAYDSVGLWTFALFLKVQRF